jgi:DNA-binding NarL/FixJ family response regulator
VNVDPSSSPEGPVGLLLSRDLIFTAKVTGTARALGTRVMVAGDMTLAATMIGQWRPRVVFVDLAAEELASPAALRSFQAEAGPETTFVAFGSHVDHAALDAATAAGCTLVLPRSRFTSELPELVRRYLLKGE